MTGHVLDSAIDRAKANVAPALLAEKASIMDKVLQRKVSVLAPTIPEMVAPVPEVTPEIMLEVTPALTPEIVPEITPAIASESAAGMLEPEGTLGDPAVVDMAVSPPEEPKDSFTRIPIPEYLRQQAEPPTRNDIPVDILPKEDTTPVDTSWLNAFKGIGSMGGAASVDTVKALRDMYQYVAGDDISDLAKQFNSHAPAEDVITEADLQMFVGTKKLSYTTPPSNEQITFMQSSQYKNLNKMDTDLEMLDMEWKEASINTKAELHELSGWDNRDLNELVQGSNVTWQSGKGFTDTFGKMVDYYMDNSGASLRSAIPSLVHTILYSGGKAVEAAFSTVQVHKYYNEFVDANEKLYADFTTEEKAEAFVYALGAVGTEWFGEKILGNVGKKLGKAIPGKFKNMDFEIPSLTKAGQVAVNATGVVFASGASEASTETFLQLGTNVRDPNFKEGDVATAFALGLVGTPTVVSTVAAGDTAINTVIDSTQSTNTQVTTELDRLTQIQTDNLASIAKGESDLDIDVIPHSEKDTSISAAAQTVQASIAEVEANLAQATRNLNTEKVDANDPEAIAEAQKNIDTFTTRLKLLKERQQGIVKSLAIAKRAQLAVGTVEAEIVKKQAQIDKLDTKVPANEKETVKLINRKAKIQGEIDQLKQNKTKAEELANVDYTGLTDADKTTTTTKLTESVKSTVREHREDRAQERADKQTENAVRTDQVKEELDTVNEEREVLRKEILAEKDPTKKQALKDDLSIKYAEKQTLLQEQQKLAKEKDTYQQSFVKRSVAKTKNVVSKVVDTVAATAKGTTKFIKEQSNTNRVIKSIVEDFQTYAEDFTGISIVIDTEEKDNDNKNTPIDLSAGTTSPERVMEYIVTAAGQVTTKVEDELAKIEEGSSEKTLSVAELNEALTKAQEALLRVTRAENQLPATNLDSGRVKQDVNTRINKAAKKIDKLAKAQGIPATAKKQNKKLMKLIEAVEKAQTDEEVSTTLAAFTSIVESTPGKELSGDYGTMLDTLAERSGVAKSAIQSLFSLVEVTGTEQGEQLIQTLRKKARGERISEYSDVALANEVASPLIKSLVSFLDSEPTATSLAADVEQAYSEGLDKVSTDILQDVGQHPRYQSAAARVAKLLTALESNEDLGTVLEQNKKLRQFKGLHQKKLNAFREAAQLHQELTDTSALSADEVVLITKTSADGGRFDAPRVVTREEYAELTENKKSGEHYWYYDGDKSTNLVNRIAAENAFLRTELDLANKIGLAIQQQHARGIARKSLEESSASETEDFTEVPEAKVEGKKPPEAPKKGKEADLHTIVNKDGATTDALEVYIKKHVGAPKPTDPSGDTHPSIKFALWHQILLDAVNKLSMSAENITKVKHLIKDAKKDEILAAVKAEGINPATLDSTVKYALIKELYAVYGDTVPPPISAGEITKAGIDQLIATVTEENAESMADILESVPEPKEGKAELIQSVKNFASLTTKEQAQVNIDLSNFLAAAKEEASSKAPHWLYNQPDPLRLLVGEGAKSQSKFFTSLAQLNNGKGFDIHKLFTADPTTADKTLANFPSIIFTKENILRDHIIGLLADQKNALPAGNKLSQEEHLETLTKYAKTIARKFFAYRKAYAGITDLHVPLSQVYLTTDLVGWFYNVEKVDGVTKINTTLPDALLFSMFMRAENWLVTEGTSDPLSNERLREAFFYGTLERKLNEIERNELTTPGGHKIGRGFATVASSIGTKIIRNTGLKPVAYKKDKNGSNNKTNIANRVQESITEAVGMLALRVMEEMYSSTEVGSNKYLSNKKDRQYKIKIFKHTFVLKGDEHNPIRTYNGKSKSRKADSARYISVIDNAYKILADTPLNSKRERQLYNTNSTSKKEIYDINVMYALLSGDRDFNYGEPLQEIHTDAAKPKFSHFPVSSKLQEVVQGLNKVPWGPTEILDVALELYQDDDSQEAMLNLSEFVHDPNIFTQVDQGSLIAQNDNTLAVLRDLIAYREAGLLDKFYIPHGVMNQYRIMQHGKVSPQSSHITRYLVKSHAAVTFTPDNINWFKLAVVFNLQRSPDKLTREQVLLEFDKIMNDPVIVDAVQTFSAESRASNKAKGKALQNIMDAGYDADVSLLSGVFALMKATDMVEGKLQLKDTFVSDIAMEVDGISNGIAMAIMQFPFFNTEELRRKLEQVGNFNKDHFTAAEFEQHLVGIEDIYVSLANLMTDQFTGKKGKEILGALHNMFGSLISKNETDKGVTYQIARNLVKYPALIFIYGGQAKRIASESVHELLTALQRNIAILNADSTSLSRKIAKVKKKIAEVEQQQNTIQAEKTKALEAFSAADTTLALPGISKLESEHILATLDKEKALAVIKQVNKKLEEAKVSKNKKQEKLSTLDSELQSITNEAIRIQKGVRAFTNLTDIAPTDLHKVSKFIGKERGDIEKFSITENLEYSAFRAKLESKFETAYQNSLQTLFSGAEDGLGGISAGRDAINESVTLVYAVFQTKLNAEISKFVNAQGYIPAKTTIKQMIRDQLQSVFPHYKGPLDVGNSAIDMAGTAQPRIVSRHFKDDPAFTKALSASQINVKYKEGTPTDRLSPILTQYEASGLKAVIRQIINLDATIQAETIAGTDFTGLSLYDAKMTDALSAATHAFAYSDNYINTNMQVNLSQAAYDNVTSVFAVIKPVLAIVEQQKNTQPKNRTDIDALNNTENYLDTWKSLKHTDKEYAGNFTTLIESSLDTLKLHAKAKEKFNKMFDNWGSLQMRIPLMQGGNVEVAPQHSLSHEVARATQEIGVQPSIDTEVDFSLDSLTRANITPNTTFLAEGQNVGRITVNNFTTLYTAFADISDGYYQSKGEQLVHEKQLTTILDIMAPVLENLKNIKLEISDIDGLTQGEAGKHRNIVSMYLDRKSVPDTLFAMTPAEVYVHENGHILLTRAFKNDYKLQRKAQRMLSNLKGYMNDNGKYKVFLKGVSNPTPADIAMAKRLYNYLLDNPGKELDELAEFVMLATTNRQYISALEAFKNTPKHADATGWFTQLMQIINTAIDSIIRTINNTADNKAYDDILDLAKELVQAQTTQIDKYAIAMEKISSALATSNKAIQAYTSRVHRKIRSMEIEGKFQIPLSIYVGATAMLNKNVYIRLIREELISKIGLKTIRDILHELGNGVLSNKMTLLLLKSKHQISKLRRMVEIAYENHFKQLLPTVTESEERMLTRIVLDADLSALSLLGMSSSKILKVLGDSALSSAQRDKLLAEVDSNIVKQVLPYLDELAHYMATGEADVTGAIRDGYDNVYALLVDKIYRHEQVPNKVLKRLDAYVTLKALEVLGPQEMSVLKQLSTESLNDLLQEHLMYKNEALVNLFDGDKYGMKKGYTKKRIDPFIHFKIGTASDTKQYRALGYTTRIDLGVIPDVNNTASGNFQKSYIFIGKYTPNAKLISGGASFTEMTPSHKFDLHRLGKDGTTLNNQDIKHIQQQLQKHKIKTPVNIRPIRKRFVTASGDTGFGIVGYRAILGNEIEHKMLNIDRQFSDVMAHMKSNYHDQVMSQSINNKWLTLFDEERRKLYKNNKFKFVDILAAPYNTYYDRLPRTMQKSIHDRKDSKGRYMIREEVLDKTLGFLQDTVADLLIDPNVNPQMYKWVNRVTHALKALMQSAVERIALGTVAVIKSNIISNIYQLTIRGIDPRYMIKKVREGYVAYKEYTTMYVEVAKLQERIKKFNLPSKHSTVKRTTALKSRMKVNPMHQFFKYGLNSMIVEEVNEASHTGYYSHVIEQTLFGKKVAKLPQGILDVAQTISLSPNSKAFTALKHVVAMTDLLARYVMVEHAGDTAKRKGTSIKAAKDAELIEALRAFVVFDENLSPKLQLLSDLGLWWFARYFFRNQRVALDLVSKYPTNTAIAAGIQYTTDFDALGNLNSTWLAGDVSPMLMNQLTGWETVFDPTYGLSQAEEIAKIFGVTGD